MQKTICFDFGNTRLKAAIFHENEFIQEMILPNAENQTIEQIIDQYQPTKSILSSVYFILQKWKHC